MQNKGEHFIPIGRDKLLECLPEFEKCSESDRSQLIELFDLLSSALHSQYHSEQINLQRLYQPLDPDSILVLKEDTNKDSSEVFRQVDKILQNANYQKLPTGELKTAVENATALGLRMKVDFSLFEELHVYGRGDETETWTKKSWWKFFKEEKFDVKVFQRLIIAFRLKDHDDLPKGQSSSFVYLKSFKGIPHSDLHTLLPGTQVKMTLLDRGKIIIPALSGIVMSIVKIVRLMVAVAIFATLANFIKFWVIPAGIIYYIIKGFLSYKKTQDKYQLNLTRNLYFQNLDNNSGVLLRILNEAELQDYRELVIAYYVLWRFGKAGMRAKQIDDIAEHQLFETINQKIDFEVDDALEKLESIKLIYKEKGLWFPLNIDESMKELNNALSK
ncbi:MAG: DUF3754 domain-containing protein [Verrucomicrobiales bacterium]|nr:MAG: DUF3754 domain-containing protein [Verrucomicrobiaceae bacterium]